MSVIGQRLALAVMLLATLINFYTWDITGYGLARLVELMDRLQASSGTFRPPQRAAALRP
jgi:hypothetical protein